MARVPLANGNHTKVYISNNYCIVKFKVVESLRNTHEAAAVLPRRQGDNQEFPRFPVFIDWRQLKSIVQKIKADLICWQ